VVLLVFAAPTGVAHFSRRNQRFIYCGASLNLLSGGIDVRVRGVCQDREYVIARQTRDVLQKLIPTHAARQIFENIDGCDPSTRDAELTAADTGSDVNMLPQFVRRPGRLVT
jgi:hypothetical protein